jgi:acyl carrier protein
MIMLMKMKQVIAEQLGVDEDFITMDTSFEDDLNADSLDLVELLMVLEDTYDMEFPAEDLETFKTVGDVVNYLKAKGLE